MLLVLFKIGTMYQYFDGREAKQYQPDSRTHDQKHCAWRYDIRCTRHDSKKNKHSERTSNIRLDKDDKANDSDGSDDEIFFHRFLYTYFA